MISTAYGYSNVKDLASSPLYFQRSGDVYPPDKYIVNAGSSGGYWSSTIYSANDAYRLNFFGASTINPSLSYDRFVGRSVRCLVLGV